MSDRTLGGSTFNYVDCPSERWIHYGEQVALVLSLEPTSVLEVGPGDHTVADFLERKGVQVDTIDLDPALRPTWVADIRQPLPCSSGYDVVLASEVLEHMPYEQSLVALGNLVSATRDGGAVVVSVPYTTLRLWPRRPDYGRVVSPEGRIHTGIPARWAQRVRWPLRLARAAANRRWSHLLTLPGTRLVAPDDVSAHHWDAGDARTSIAHLERDFGSLATMDRVVVSRSSNAVFFVLRRQDDRARG